MPNTPHFETVEVAPNRHLHYLIDGPPSAPMVLYDAGAFGIYADGWWVKEALKHNFRVCLYDRAGMGASSPPPVDGSPSPKFHVEDMRALLRAIGNDGPIVLIGHSMAGLRLHAFANLYPDELLGLVFVDALSPRGFMQTGARFGMDQFANMLNVGTFGAKLGVAEHLAPFAPNNFQLTGQVREDKVWSYAASDHHQGSCNEVRAIDYDADYLHGNGVSRLPIAIFASTSINGMTEEDAETSKKNAGYGWFGKFPREDHVSILTGVYADVIATRVSEIAHHGASFAAGRTGT